MAIDFFVIKACMIQNTCLFFVFFVLLLVIPMIKERMGDGKEQVREKTQLLIQQIMQDSVSSPQVMQQLFLFLLLPYP